MSHHDVVVIGAGLAGLTAAVRLAEGGARVLVLAKGVGATHLSPGTIDLIGYASLRRGPARALAPDRTAQDIGEHARMTVTETTTQDFKVADLSLAEFGRKEIRLAEHEMPGLMALRAYFDAFWESALAGYKAAAEAGKGDRG